MGWVENSGSSKLCGVVDATMTYILSLVQRVLLGFGNALMTQQASPFDSILHGLGGAMMAHVVLRVRLSGDVVPLQIVNVGSVDRLIDRLTEVLFLHHWQVVGVRCRPKGLPPRLPSSDKLVPPTPGKEATGKVNAVGTSCMSLWRYLPLGPAFAFLPYCSVGVCQHGWLYFCFYSTLAPCFDLQRQWRDFCTWEKL